MNTLVEELRQSIEVANAKTDKIFVSHLILFCVFQVQDLLATKQMIAQNGLWVEVNDMAKYLFLNKPEIVDPLKLLAEPALILLCMRWAYRRSLDTNQQRLPLVAMSVINTVMAAAVLMDAYSNVLKTVDMTIFETWLTILIAMTPVLFWVLRDLEAKN